MRIKFKRGLGPDSRFVRTLAKKGMSLNPDHVRRIKRKKGVAKLASNFASLGQDLLKRANAPRLKPVVK